MIDNLALSEKVHGASGGRHLIKRVVSMFAFLRFFLSSWSIRTTMRLRTRRRTQLDHAHDSPSSLFGFARTWLEAHSGMPTKNSWPEPGNLDAHTRNLVLNIAPCWVSMFMTCRQNKSTAMLIQGSQHVMAQISCARDTWPTLTEQRTPSVPMLLKHMLFACFDSGRWLMPFRNRNARSGACNHATHSMEKKILLYLSACIAHVSQIIQFLPVRYRFLFQSGSRDR